MEKDINNLDMFIDLYKKSENLNVDEILELGVEYGIELTKSKISFFHFINPDQETISLQKGSAKTMEMCNTPELDKHYPISKAGVWADCFHQRKPVYHNDYEELSHKKGIPEGHVALLRDLAVPVFSKEKIVAILGVGNKEEYYTDRDAKLLSVLADYLWNIIRRKESEQELVRAKEKVEESKARLLESQAAAKLGSWQTDLSNLNVIWSNEVYNVFEVEKKTFKSSHEAFLEFVHPDDREDVDKAFFKSHNTDDYNTIEHRIITAKGNLKYIEERWRSVKNEQGDPIFAIGTCLDITELKRNEIELEKQSLFVNTLLDNLKVGVVACDSDGKLTYFNKATQNFHGIPQEEIRSDNWAEYYDLYLADGKTKMQTKDIPLFKALEGENFNDIGMMIIPKKGKSYSLAASGSAIFDASGEKRGAVVSMYDISERKEKQKALQESNKTKDKFFSIIAHDLKSPFNSLMGFSQILDKNYDNFDSEKKKKFIKIISQGLQDTHKLLENLLYWSRSQRGTIDFKPQKVNLYLLCEEICELLNSFAVNKSIKLLNQLPENIFVYADEDMLSTIIRNLISNAIKFTPRGGEIRINAQLLTNEGQSQFTEITVKDNGIGISKEVQSKLFDIGESISTQGTDNESGTGLGLILCYEFVTKHGGKIWVESEERKGSDFKFTLPLDNS